MPTMSGMAIRFVRTILIANIGLCFLAKQILAQEDAGEVIWYTIHRDTD